MKSKRAHTHIHFENTKETNDVINSRRHIIFSSPSLFNYHGRDNNNTNILRYYYAQAAKTKTNLDSQKHERSSHVLSTEEHAHKKRSVIEAYSEQKQLQSANATKKQHKQINNEQMTDRQRARHGKHFEHIVFMDQNGKKSQKHVHG